MTALGTACGTSSGLIAPDVFRPQSTAWGNIFGTTGVGSGYGKSRLVHTVQDVLTGSPKDLVGSNKAEFVMLSSSEGLDITRSKEVMVIYFQGFPRKHPEKIHCTGASGTGSSRRGSRW